METRGNTNPAGDEDSMNRAAGGSARDGASGMMGGPAAFGGRPKNLLDATRGTILDWYEDEVRSLERSLRDRPPAPGALVFYGSSSVRLWETLAADFEGVPVVNLGFGGSTLEACAHFFERLVPPARPRSILLYAGDNDLGDGRTPEDVLASYLALAAKRDRLLGGTPLAFLSIKPSPARWGLDARVRRANALVRRAASGTPAASFLDVYPRMLGPDGAPRPELYAEDGLHLSPEGYRLWAAFLREPAHTLFSS